MIVFDSARHARYNNGLSFSRVDPRKNVEVHWGNTVRDIDGCILVGTKGELEIGGVNYPAVLDSDFTLKKLISVAGDTGKITITSTGD